METIEELQDEHRLCTVKLRWLRSLGTNEEFRNLSAEEKKYLHDQEYHLSEYVRNLNRRITLRNSYKP